MEKVKILVNRKEVKNIFTCITWTGGINGTARKLNVKYIADSLIADLGDTVEFIYEDEKLFIGKVFGVSKKGENKNKSFYCYDNSIYLNKNKFIKNFFKTPPSKILKTICGELNLKVGNIPKDEVVCTYPAIDRSGYEIILNAYTIQHRKNKKIYSVVSNNEKIEIIEQGTCVDVKISSHDVIQTSSYSQNIDNMINQIVIYKTEKEKTQIIDKVANEEDKKKFGIFQNTLEFEKDKNNIENAREMLKSIESAANIKCLGNTLIQSGYSIGVYEPNVNLVGVFLVKNDTHVFAGEDYYCDIELAFENAMDKVEFENKKKAKKKKGKKKKPKKKKVGDKK